MSEIPIPPDRKRRLEEIRAAVKEALASGAMVDAAFIRENYPELTEEIDALLSDSPTIAGSPGSEKTMVAPPSKAGPDADDTIPASLSAVIRGRTPDDETREDLGKGDRDDDETMAGETMVEANLGDATLPIDGTAISVNPRDMEPLPAGERVRYVGDYLLLTVLGVGGMGIVYKARQLSLNRPVALKMIKSAEFAGEDQLRRFQNEAEAVAQLDHPGIVPIYEVGQHDDKRYFSMKLIEGLSLEKHLEAKPLDLRSAAELIKKVALAVDHAHRRGILHRDLKPANILIDGKGDPHVTDFGLAKKIEGDEGLTMSGAILGTPAFMAPEQALGRIGEITTASDVYGIGAVMYATLTGKKPFRANSVLETLEQVRHVPPEPPTHINAKVPRDLEVICLKCMEKDPRRRYESARDLADDLDRWLNGEPIKARPVGRLVRAGMWCRRNPVLAGLGAALAAALIVGVVGITVQWREAVHQRGLALAARDKAIQEEAAARKAEAEAKSARDAAVASEKAAVAARAAAEQSAILAAGQTTQALQTIQDLILRVRSINDPAFVDIRKEITDSALQRVDKVAEGYEKGTSKEATTAAALQDLGRIYRELGQSEKSLRMFRKCDEIYQARLVVKNRNDASRTNVARNYLQLGIAVTEVNRDLKASLDYYKKAAEIFQEVLDHPRTPNPGDLRLPPAEGKLLLATALQDVGTTYLRMGDKAAALEWFRKGYNVRRDLKTQLPTQMLVISDLSSSTLAMAEASFRMGDLKAAKDFIRETADLREQVVEKLPKDRVAKARLGDVYFNEGWLGIRLRDPDTARIGLEKSLKIRQELVGLEPRNAINQRALGMTLYYLGVRAEMVKDEATAKDFYAKTLELRTKLAESDPENDRRQMELMLIQAATGEVKKALAIADRVAVGPNIDNEVRIDLARCHALVAKATAGKDQAASDQSKAKALGFLRDAVKAGFADRVAIETEFDFGSIRDDPGFVQLLKEMPK